MASKRHQEAHRVEGVFNYVPRDVENSVTTVSKPGEDERLGAGESIAHPCSVTDARPLAESLGLDRSGFAIVDQKTAVTDFYDDDQLQTVYRPELEAVVQKATGARRVVAFDMTLRAEDPETQIKRNTRGPVKRVHNDYTDRSAPRRVRDFMGDEAEALLKGRFAIVNVWRPLFGPLESKPLAIIDARTIAPDDLIPTERRSADRIGEIQHVAHNPDHAWYYFPRQDVDEAVLIKCFDSETDGRARFTAHAAFDDPETPTGARARESIEARCFAFF